MPRILQRGRFHGAQISVPREASMGAHSRAGGHAGFLFHFVVYGCKNTARSDGRSR